MESLVYVTLAPLATVLMLVVGLVAWRRRDQPGGWALVAFSILEAGWLVTDTLAVVRPTPEETLWLTKSTYVFSPLLGVAWLVFVLSYTERFSRAAKIWITALAGWCIVFSGFTFTNDIHRLVWSSWAVVGDGEFLRLTYTLGPLAWAQTLFMYGAMVASFFAILVAYAGASGRTRALSRWIVAGALVPLAVNVLHQFGWGPLSKDFTPLAMAVSSAAFALGLARYQLLDLRPIARTALVDDLREGMLVLDARGRIADANPAMQRIAGQWDSILGDTLESVMPRLAEAIQEQSDVPFQIGKEEKATYFDVRVSPLTDRRGRQTGRLILLHDVTRRRQERAALHLANAELMARNDELDSFAHTVAHDLKNSIQGVMGYAEILRDDGPTLDPVTHRELSENLVRSSHKMGSIVHELLLLSGVRQESFETRPVHMAPVVEEALERISNARPRLNVLVSLPESWPVALGHAPWIEEVWANYLGNAVKYGGPTITLGSDKTASGAVRYWVHDDGPGIPAESHHMLFVPFMRIGTASTVEGHGLGLSIVQRIVERLDGLCGVESEPGLGTRFWFTLPLAPVAEVVS